MSATATGTAMPRGVTKLSQALGAALEVDGMKDRVEKEAKRDAERILKATCDLRVPIRPVAIANELGVEVLESEFDDDILGVLRVGREADPKIVVNKSHGVLRRRLTCALELGHFVRLSPEPQEYERTDLRSLRVEGAGGDPDERYAGKFAECLLMPEEDVRVLFELGLDDLDLALRFRVPRETVWSRLNGLDLRPGRKRAA